MALYEEMAYERTHREIRYKQRDLIRRTRAMLRRTHASWERAQNTQDKPYDAIVASFMREGIEAVRDEVMRQRMIALRAELLTLLARSNSTQNDRRQQARQFIADQLDFFTGWELMCAQSAEYQLQSRAPWWRPGNFFDNEEERERLRTPERLREHSFFQVSQDAYRERIRQPLMMVLMQNKPSPLEPLAAVISLYTSSARSAEPLCEQTANVFKGLVADCTRELQRQQCSLPMKPLYSLPREANNISTFFVSRAEELELEPSQKLVRGALDKARVKIIDDRAGQRALFFDTDLVVKKSGSQDAFISLELDEPGPDVLGALMKAIEKFDIDPNVFEHLPRVCAGLFAAAQRDRRLKFNYPGTFWDTESGYRLCRIIGFDPMNKRHRKRVQDARQVLETFILHREIRGRDEKGRKIDVKWSGPIIEPRKARLELTISEREGLSEHHVFQSWSIAKELWEMTLSEDDGGTPAFMLLDQRAFELDARSSLPFNLYWTLVNRAYMSAYTHVDGDKLSADGTFSPRLWTLHQWAGMERGRVRINRVCERFREALDLMVNHGLLENWHCEALREGASPSMDELREARVKVWFTSDQLDTFPSQLTALN